MEKPYVPFYKPYGMTDEEYEHEVRIAEEKLAEWEEQNKNFGKDLLIQNLKRGDTFVFNNTDYLVKQKFSDWQKNGEPYLKTVCGQLFYFGELKITKK